MSNATRESIRRLFSDDTEIRFPNGAIMTKGDWAAQRAVCRLWACQMADEQAAAVTEHSNRIGFNKSHAKIGKHLADWMDEGQGDGVMRRRVGGQCWFQGRRQDRIEVVRYLASFYAGQLADFANGDKRNAARKVAAQ